MEILPRLPQPSQPFCGLCHPVPHNPRRRPSHPPLSYRPSLRNPPLPSPRLRFPDQHLPRMMGQPIRRLSLPAWAPQPPIPRRQNLPDLLIHPEGNVSRALRRKLGQTRKRLNMRMLRLLAHPLLSKSARWQSKHSRKPQRGPPARMSAPPATRLLSRRFRLPPKRQPRRCRPSQPSRPRSPSPRLLLLPPLQPPLPPPPRPWREIAPLEFTPAPFPGRSP